MAEVAQNMSSGGTPSPTWFRNHLIRDAIGRALYEAMEDDPRIYLFGEGAHVKVHFDAPAVEQRFPDRVITLPISEDANTNFAVGASLLGVVPVVDVITADFLYRTLDAIANTAAKLNTVGGGVEEPRTLVIRSEYLAAGPTTGQRPEALFTHIPGLNVVVPSTPRDAYGLMRTALATPGVTVFFEDRMIADSETEAEDLATETVGPIPFGRAAVRVPVWANPLALTVVSYGLARQMTEGVLRRLHLEGGVELLDLRTLYPLDWSSLEASARRSKHILVIEPDVQYGGVGAEIVAQIAEWMPDVRVRRLGAPRWTLPASAEVLRQLGPTAADIGRVLQEALRWKAEKPEKALQ